jgi:hypothetical protein
VTEQQLSHQCRAGYHILCRAYRAGLCTCRCHSIAGDRFRLEWIAPRLALARDQRVAELIAEYEARHRARQDLQRAEWLVAHRELQLIRAGARNDRRYVARREAKLVRARQDLARIQAHAEQIGAIPTTPSRRAA